MELQEIKKQLWNSVDRKHHGRMLFACTMLLSVTAALCWLLIREFAWVVLSVGGLLLLVLLWKLLRIFYKVSHYTVFRTTLSAPKGDRKAVAFPVKAPDGTQCWTDRIFYIRNLQPLLSDWLDQTVTVAWNRETGRVIVIGK